MASKIPRLVIAGLSGDAGKTIVSMSLLAEFRRKALAVSAFKKGPDYIDSAWLTWLAGSSCRNLDTFMVPRETVRERFFAYAENSDIALIEGNRGLFDGKDSAGTHSTAELAKLTGTPVILVVNCTKTTRTVAAMVKGCQATDPDLNLVGVILNNIAGDRHRRIITDAIDQTCGLPVLGAIPKLKEKAELIPGRHLGLVPPTEYSDNEGLAEILNNIAAEYLDVDRIIGLASQVEPVEISSLPKSFTTDMRVKIGWFKDEVFTFYYPENLEALESAGAELVPISSLTDTLPDGLDGLYIGGGFPETKAERLTENRSLMQKIRTVSDMGMPIYAECGGLIYLCRSLTWNDRTFEMAGVFPIDLVMQKRPAGHGYCEFKATEDNAYYKVGETIRGHEFHYSRPADRSDIDGLTLQVITGHGMDGKMDGLSRKRTFASYLHTHADGNIAWAERMIRNAQEFNKKKSQKKSDCGNVTDLNERAAG